MSEARKKKAEEIAAEFLRRTGAAIMSNDFAVFRDCFNLPHVAETFEATNVIETEEDLRFVFSRVRGRFLEMGVTDLVRNVVAADFQSDDLIEVAYETRLMHKRHLLQDPYPSYGQIALIDDAWKITDAKYATNVPRLISAFRSRGKDDANDIVGS